MRIIYAQSNGVLAVLAPSIKFLNQLTGTDEEKMIHIANKDLPTGIRRLYKVCKKIRSCKTKSN